MAANSTQPVSVKSTPANTYQIGVSTTPSTRKPQGKEIAALRFKTTRVTRDQLVERIKRGHTLCHNFGHREGEVFPIKEKTNKRFAFADMVMVDVDDSSVDMQTLTDSLALAPSIAFTTYSNVVKGYRFRLIYLFSDHLTSEQYKDAYRAVVWANGLTLSDNCMSSFAQCSFTNGSGSVEVITTDEVYSLDRLGIVDGGQIVTSELISKKTDTLSTLRLQNDHTTQPKSGILAELDGMDWKDFVLAYRNKYEQINHTHLNFTDGYAILDDSYIEIYRRYYVDYYEIRGEERRTPRVKKLRDGEMRQHKLWCASVIRRRIKPSITFDELVYNAICDVVYHNDNSDKRFTTASVCDVCAKVMRMDDAAIEGFPIKPDKRGYRLDPSVYTTKQARQHGRRAVKRLITDRQIEKYFNPCVGDKENLAILFDNGVKITRKRLAEYKKDHGIKLMTKAELIGSMYDPSLSDKENLAVFKQHGLVVSLKTLRRWRADNNIEKGGQIVTSELISNTTDTLSTLRLQNDHTQAEQADQPTEENQETTEVKASSIDKVIEQLDKQIKPGYRKLFANLYEFMKPLSPVIKEIDEVGDAERAFSWFTRTIDILQYNSLDDKMTITAYTRLFINRIEALRAA